MATAPGGMETLLNFSNERVVFMGLFDIFKKQKTTLTPSVSLVYTPKAKPLTALKTENHHVAGVTHYMDNIMSLAVENEDYLKSKKEIVEDYLTDERIFQYYWDVLKVDLIEEPDNPHDANAVKVLIDGVHVGYIKKGSCSHIKKMLHSEDIVKISAQIGGGKYKYVYEDEETEKYIMDKDELPIGITLVIELN